MKERDIKTLHNKYPFLKDLEVVEPISYNCKRINDSEIEILNKSTNIYIPPPVAK